LGYVREEVASLLGLGGEVPVAVSGHDHSCAAMAVGAFEPGIVYDSMGTAESLMGTLPEGPLGEAEFTSGLTFGCHILPGYMFWMGGAGPCRRFGGMVKETYYPRRN